jgi:hypothetical protein
MKKIIAFTALIGCICSTYATEPTVTQAAGSIRTTEKVKPAVSVGAPYGTMYNWIFRNDSDKPMTNVVVSVQSGSNHIYQYSYQLLPAHTSTPYMQGQYGPAVDWWRFSYNSDGPRFYSTRASDNQYCSVFNEDVDSGNPVVVVIGNYDMQPYLHAYGTIVMPKTSNCGVTMIT